MQTSALSTGWGISFITFPNKAQSKKVILCVCTLFPTFTVCWKPEFRLLNKLFKWSNNFLDKFLLDMNKYFLTSTSRIIISRRSKGASVSPPPISYFHRVYQNVLKLQRVGGAPDGLTPILTRNPGPASNNMHGYNMIYVDSNQFYGDNLRKIMHFFSSFWWTRMRFDVFSHHFT